MATRAIIVHDTKDFPEPFAESFTYKGVSTKAFETARQALDFIKSPKGMELDCMIIHKDLGDYSGEGGGQVEKVVDLLHKRNPTTRVGIVSGEYPHGEKHVLGLGADFYFQTIDFSLNQEWVLKQVKKGPVLPDEINSRGKKVETPRGYFRSPESKG